jgi:hypothetical protein
MWHLYMMEFYSATKKNKIFSFAGKWTKLENITLNEGLEGQKSHFFLSYVEYKTNTNAALL